MPHRITLLRPGHPTGERERFTLGRETLRLPTGVGEPRFSAGQGASRQPTNFALALADFESETQPLVLRARRLRFEEDLKSGLLFRTAFSGRSIDPFGLRGAAPTATRARLLRRKLTPFGTVTNPLGTSVSEVDLTADLVHEAFPEAFDRTRGRGPPIFSKGRRQVGG